MIAWSEFSSSVKLAETDKTLNRINRFKNLRSAREVNRAGMIGMVNSRIHKIKCHHTLQQNNLMTMIQIQKTNDWTLQQICDYWQSQKTVTAWSIQINSAMNRRRNSPFSKVATKKRTHLLAIGINKITLACKNK